MDPIARNSAEHVVRAIEKRRKELHAAWFQGYRRSDVDAYLDEVVEALRLRIQENETLRAGVSVPLPRPGEEGMTPFDVQSQEFEIARFGQGYKMRDVDDYLDDLTDVLSRVEAENEALRAQRGSS